MTGDDLQLLGNICTNTLDNYIFQLKGENDGNEQEPEEDKWQVIQGIGLSSDMLINNSLPSNYYKKIKVNFNAIYGNSQKTINEVGLYIKAEKNISFTLQLGYGKGSALKFTKQTFDLMAGQEQAVMFCIYESMQNIDCLEFSNQTEIKGVDDIVKWTMKDVKVSFNS